MVSTKTLDLMRRMSGADQQGANSSVPDGTKTLDFSKVMPNEQMVMTDFGDTLPAVQYTSSPAGQRTADPVSWVRNATIEDLPNIGNPGAIYQREKQQTLDAIAAHTGGTPGKVVSSFEKCKQGDPDAIRNAQRDYGEWRAAGGDRKAAAEKREFLQHNPNARQIINEAFGSAEKAEKLLAKIDNDYQTKLPAWEADVKQRVQQDANQARQWENSTSHLAGFPETGYVSKQIAGVHRDHTPQEQKDFATAKRIMKRSVYAYQTQSALEQELAEMDGKGDTWHERFWHGLKPRTADDFASLGWAETVDLNRVAQISEKASQGQPLTAGEKALAQAYVIGLDAEARLQYLGGATGWEEAGRSLGNNAPFLIEMALTGGFGTTVANAAKGLVRKGLVAGVKKMAGRTAEKVLQDRAVQAGIKGVSAIVGTTVGGAAMAPFSNVTYRNYADRTNDQYDVQMDEMGNFIAEKTRPTSKLERSSKSLASASMEFGSELLGGEIGRVTLGKLLPNAMKAKLSQTKVGEALGWLRQKIGDTPSAQRVGTYLGDTFKFYGLPMEVFTEEYNNFMEPLLTGEPERLRENFSEEAQWDLMLAVTAMSAGFGAVRLPFAAKDHIRYRTEASLQSILDSITSCLCFV